MESMGELKNKTILVTGGTGFIGSHLVEALVEKGASVIVPFIEILTQSLFVVNGLEEKAFVQKINITDYKSLHKLISEKQVDYIIHLAAQTLVTKAYLDPYETLETNIMGSVNILESARKIASVKGVVVASSDKAYGKTKNAYTESSPLAGDHPYDVSKSSADLISQAYAKTYGLAVVVTRFGNIYGEGDLHFERIIPGICKAIIKNEILEIRSDGSYIRDYLYVKDVVEGYIHLLIGINAFKGETYNFSSTETLSVLELIKKAERILNVKIPYKIMNSAKNEIPYQHLQDAKIRKTGWKNNYSLESVLPKVVEWYKKIL